MLVVVVIRADRQRWRYHIVGGRGLGRVVRIALRKPADWVPRAYSQRPIPFRMTRGRFMAMSGAGIAAGIGVFTFTRILIWVAAA
jgi:hypothetical protein